MGGVLRAFGYVLGGFWDPIGVPWGSQGVPWCAPGVEIRSPFAASVSEPIVEGSWEVLGWFGELFWKVSGVYFRCLLIVFLMCFAIWERICYTLSSLLFSFVGVFCFVFAAPANALRRFPVPLVSTGSGKRLPDAEGLC